MISFSSRYEKKALHDIDVVPGRRTLSRLVQMLQIRPYHFLGDTSQLLALLPAEHKFPEFFQHDLIALDRIVRKLALLQAISDVISYAVLRVK